MKVLGWLTHSEKIIILHFVSGINFSPRVLIYPNTFIQGQYIYNNKFEENDIGVALPSFIERDKSFFLQKMILFKYFLRSCHHFY